MPDATARTGSSPDASVAPAPVTVPTVCLAGSLAWLVVLVVTLAVPALHTGERSWWPWTAVVGLVLGVAGWFYVGRGRGNAAGA